MAFIPYFIPPKNRNVEFKCGKCGRDAESLPPVPQCPICLIPICNQCSTFGFCHEHFYDLTEEDRRLIIENYKPGQNRVNNRSPIMVFLLSFMVFFGIFFVFRNNIDLPIFLSPVILIGVITLALGVIFAVVSVRRGRNSKFQYMISRIGKKYRDQSVPEIRRNEKEDERNGNNKIYCQKCGTYSEDGNYCNRCGEKLI